LVGVTRHGDTRGVTGQNTGGRPLRWWNVTQIPVGPPPVRWDGRPSDFNPQKNTIADAYVPVLESDGHGGNA
jgi:hypothetical protein